MAENLILLNHDFFQQFRFSAMMKLSAVHYCGNVKYQLWSVDDALEINGTMCTERYGRGMEGHTRYHEENSFTANEAFSAALLKCEKL